ncbi:Bug family tripartite tricarboxylate transporter substrate binding protein [Natronorubrum sp. FCH18a]|uniref:Bug family tripartite tricarboxylate transporter substrate binding protein n=1 Tax=Natronorubrum sp. FCH18a TaxID=3447018 RepID=UPI003F511E97
MPHITSRRDVLKYGGLSIAGTSLAGCLGRNGGDGDYPNQPIRIVVPFSEGGSTDTYARQFQPHLSDELGVDIQIENIPGSASLRGAQEAYSSEPDGYTYLMMNPPSTPLSTLINETDWDITEMEGVATYESTSILITANPDLEIEDFEDLQSRFADGELNQWAGQTVGSYYHVASLYLRENYDMDFDDYIGYEGNGPATQSVVSGENPAGISSSAATEGFTEDGRLEVVALLGSVGTPAYPDVPTLPDLGYEDMDFLGNLTRTFAAPPETSDDHIETFSSAVESVLEVDELQEWGDDTGANFLYEGPEETDQLIDEVINTVPEELDIESIREQVD